MVFVGRNYADHAKEMGNAVPKEPLLFLKPVSSIIWSGDEITLHAVSSHIECEGEIGVVVGQRLSHVSETEARAAIAHIVAVNDVSARDLQKNDGQWARAKGLDTFCPLGAPGAVPDDLTAISLVTTVNGVECQRAMASDMVFSIPMLLAYISRFITLQPGDIVATGTPAGTRKLQAGDVVTVELSLPSGVLSRVSNPVVAGT